MAGRADFIRRFVIVFRWSLESSLKFGVNAAALCRRIATSTRRATSIGDNSAASN